MAAHRLDRRAQRLFVECIVTRLLRPAMLKRDAQRLVEGRDPHSPNAFGDKTPPLHPCRR